MRFGTQPLLAAWAEFPVLSGATEEMAATLGGEEQFEHGLAVVLDGIAARLPTQTAG